jgi:hypothetical protein
MTQKVLQFVTGGQPVLDCVCRSTPEGQCQLDLSFTQVPHRDHVVEFLDALETGTWEALPGGPHNAGRVFVAASTGQRFYRVRVD